MDRTFKIVKEFPNTKNQDLILKNSNIEVLDVQGQILGFANMFSNNNHVVAECFLKYTSTERLDIQVDNDIYLGIIGSRVGESGLYVSHLTLSNQKVGEITAKISHTDVE